MPLPPIEDFEGFEYALDVKTSGPPTMHKFARTLMAGLPHVQYTSPVGVPKWVLRVCESLLTPGYDPQRIVEDGSWIVHAIARATWKSRPDVKLTYPPDFREFKHLVPERVARACLAVHHPDDVPRIEQIRLFLDSLLATEKLGGPAARDALIALVTQE